MTIGGANDIVRGLVPEFLLFNRCSIHFPIGKPCRRLVIFICGALIAFNPAKTVSATEPASRPLPAIQVHSGGHYLQTDDGRPFFWLGDTAWNLIHGTTREEASYYLRTRARQGFTLIQVVVQGETTVDSISGSELKPFFDDDPQKPNDAYFARMVEIVDEASTDGLYVALLPTWGDKLTAPWGKGPRLFRLDNLPVAKAYGNYLGLKLKGRTNVVWMLGGDTPSKLDPSKPEEWPQNRAREAGFSADYDWRPIWREMAKGIAAGTGTTPVFLFHPEGAGTTSPNLHHEAWLSINGMQSGHERHDFPVWEWVARDFELTPAKPTLDLEPNYEDHPVHPWPRWNPASGYFRDYDVRKQCYRSVLAGACGVTYGHHAVWGFVGEHNDVKNHADRDWIDGLHRPGAQQMFFLRQLIESRPFFTRVPDQAMITASNPGGASYMVACRDREGSYAFVYFPMSEQKAKLDLSRLMPGKLRGWWYDPRTGFAHPLGVIESGGSREFQSPAAGSDWVLVLDSIDAGYPAPGSFRP